MCKETEKQRLETLGTSVTRVLGSSSPRSRRISSGLLKHSRIPPPRPPLSSHKFKLCLCHLYLTDKQILSIEHPVRREVHRVGAGGSQSLLELPLRRSL